MILVVVGTRPEEIKMRPVVAEARRRGLEVEVWNTHQSADLSGKELAGDVPPQAPLGLFGRAALVVVQGDTRTATHAAVLAYEQGVPVFHVEAGVRTYDLSSPWPEEGYRQMISRIATYHACTTRHNRENLVARDSRVLVWPDDSIRLTGSPVVDALAGVTPVTTPSRFMVVTLHRRENRGHFGDILTGIATANRQVYWPAHPNGWAVEEAPKDLAFSPVPPMDHDTFRDHLKAAWVVVTDSGGVQEECNALGVPCVVARTVTDRPESLGKGGAILGGVTADGIANAIRDASFINRSTIDRTCFGDGTASQQIVNWWCDIVGAP